ncbi:MAG: GNAT family N-acetyltransferase [Pseudomonadota bacterium]
MQVHIRDINLDDRPSWEILWKGYQEYYEVNLDHETGNLWRRLMQRAPDGPIGLIAEVDGKVVGFTHFLYHAHTWTEKKRIYLVDLYTEPNLRGKGIGRKLIEAVYAIGDETGAESVYWLTQDFNEAGRALYDKVGKLTPFIKYQQP